MTFVIKPSFLKVLFFSLALHIEQICKKIYFGSKACFLNFKIYLYTVYVFCSCFFWGGGLSLQSFIEMEELWGQFKLLDELLYMTITLSKIRNEIQYILVISCISYNMVPFWRISIVILIIDMKPGVVMRVV
jgi:hypothetical protein